MSWFNRFARGGRSSRSARKSNTRRDRRLGVETLEDRRLMSVAPMASASDLMAASREAKAFMADPVAAQAPVSLLVRGQPVHSLDLHDGDTDVVLGEYLLQARQTKPLNLAGVYIIPAEGSASLALSVSTLSFMGDMDGKSWNGCETLLGTGVPDPITGLVHIETAGEYWLRSSRPVRTQVVADMNDSLPGGMLGVELVAVDAYTVRGQQVPDEGIYFTDSDPTMHLLVEEHATLGIVVNGPASQVYATDQQDAVLANVTYAASEAELLKHQYVLVEAKTPTGEALAGGIASAMKGVELWNPVTGRTVYGVRLTGLGDKGTVMPDGNTVSTYQVYRFDDILMKGGTETWQVRCDFVGGSAIPDGTQFRAWVNVATTAQSTCGILPATAKYDLQAVEWDSGKVVETDLEAGALAGNLHAVAAPHLSVQELSGPAAGTAVANEKNVLLGRFEVRAEVKNVLLTDVHIVASQGDLRNTTNWKVWFDTDGNGSVDTICGTGYYFNNPLVRFEFVNGGIVNVKEETVLYEIRADVAGSLMPDPRLQVSISYIAAETVDRGTALGQDQITLTSVPQTLLSFVECGSLYVSQDVLLLDAQQVLAGGQSVDVLRVKMTATEEASDVTKFTLYVLSGQEGAIDRFELAKPGAATYFAVATMANTGMDYVPAGYTAFTAKMQSQQLIVPEGGDQTVIVRVRPKSEDNGAWPNSLIQPRILPDAVISTMTGRGAIHARGLDSSNTLAGNDGTATPGVGTVILGRTDSGPNQEIVSAENLLVMSKLANVVNAGPAEDVLTAGVTEVGRWTFTAMTNVNTRMGVDTWEWDAGTIWVHMANASITRSSLTLYNMANANMSVSTFDVLDMDGNLITSEVLTGDFRLWFHDISWGIESELHSGEAMTFALRGVVADANINAAVDSVLEASLDLENGFLWTDWDLDTSLTMLGSGLKGVVNSTRRTN
ncbi:MAG: hypothetical protein PHW10_04415 [Candidatus Peribacteraceae bacterium]|nr:hypothetical protein [Candidatus Peribacteraceae bacterium]